MNKQQKTETLQNVSMPSLFSEKPAISRNLFLRNKPNFNTQKLIATPYGREAYNDSHPKTQNGTKPNKANSKMGNPSLFE